MTTGLTYSQYVTQIAEMAVVDPADVNFVAILPMMITYAENRIYRDLDFLFTSTSITGYNLTANNRSLTIPQGTLVVSEQINFWIRSTALHRLLACRSSLCRSTTTCSISAHSQMITTMSKLSAHIVPQASRLPTQARSSVFTCPMYSSWRAWSTSVRISAILADSPMILAWLSAMNLNTRRC
jgi:hypothetical protein